MSDHSITTHATASAGTDALRNPGPMVQASSMRAGLLNRGRTLGVGCWNVRPSLDPGTQSLTARSLYQYNVDVCWLSEVRLLDSGSREIKITGVESHFTLYHSGPRDSSGRHGVAIALSQQADLALRAWEPVNGRMAYVRLKGHFMNISIVSVYASTSAAEQCDTEVFYSQLQALVERLPRRDLLIVAGDWNGRTGPGDPTTSHLLGRFGLGSRCENVNAKPSTLSDSVRDVNGGLIADNSAKVERWREHFEHHLNFDTQLTSPLLFSSADFLLSPTYAVPCDPPPPSEGEVADAIRKLRNNKASGEDRIPAEIFKSCVDTLGPWLHEKGDKTGCENYRGISLIDVAAKIFAIVLLRRFRAVRDSRTRPNQAGFPAGRGCADQVFSLRGILEFRHSYQQPAAVCFIDFVAAFDSVHREALWRIMALDGVPAKIIARIKAYYRSTTVRALVCNNISQPLGIRSGIRQGCILSSILLNYATDWILGKALRVSDGVEFAPGHRLTDLDYADDIDLLASSFGDLQSMVSRVNKVAKSVGLSINAGKTKVF
nr:unnamed protein product [Spirometra erinaceieuropaei]